MKLLALPAHKRHEALVGYLFIAPYLVLFVAFVLVPVVCRGGFGRGGFSTRPYGRCLCRSPDLPRDAVDGNVLHRVQSMVVQR